MSSPSFPIPSIRGLVSVLIGVFNIPRRSAWLGANGALTSPKRWLWNNEPQLDFNNIRPNPFYNLVFSRNGRGTNGQVVYWGSGQPSGAGDCLRVSGSSKLWSDTSCGQSYRGVMEFQAMTNLGKLSFGNNEVQLDAFDYDKGYNTTWKHRLRFEVAPESDDLNAQFGEGRGFALPALPLSK